MKTINLEKEIIRRNAGVLEKEQATIGEQAKLDAEVEKVLTAADAAYRNGLMQELGFNYKLEEAQKINQEREYFAHLEKARIMDVDAIKELCIEYGLRFLPTRFYKGQLDAGIGPAVESLRKSNREKLPGFTGGELLAEQLSAQSTTDAPSFYIAAPAEMFDLQLVPVDPLLFCRLSLKKFFLVHKWGQDLEDGDSRKGRTTASNWNSHLELKPRAQLTTKDYMRLMQQSALGQLGISASSQMLGQSAQSAFFGGLGGPR